MSTARVPQGATGRITTLPAPGRKPPQHVSAGKWDTAFAWFQKIRYYQNQEHYTYDQAVEQANQDFGPAPPGRGRVRDDGSVR